MAGSSITGAVSGVQVSVSASTALQQGLASQVLSSAAQTNGVVFKTASGTLTSPTAIVSGDNSLVSGATSVPSATVLLNGQSGTYINNGTRLSTVVAADNSNSTIINANAQGAVVGVTGAGANLLEGLMKANQFVTGLGGQDLVFLQGARNSLTTFGSDGVLAGGPSTVTAAYSGMDAIAVVKGASLAFVNGSAPSAVDSISGSSGSSIVVAGWGNTSITAGAGPETFFVDTASGNVTLNTGAQASDVLVFARDGPAGTNRTTVTHFAPGDTLLLHGYAGYNVAALSGASSGAVLSLSDGSQVTFQDASAAAVTAAVKLS